MLKRKMGRIGFESSVLLFGGAKLGSVTQEEADRSIAYALEHGVNHIDTAASYGDSELRLGKWIPEIRNRVFLATKTTQRGRKEAKEDILRSLERLRTDRLDLLQLHSVGTIEELDKCVSSGGALEAALEAKEEGLVTHIGITGHGHFAPAVHLEALRRFDFETVLTPFNYYLYSLPEYRQSFDSLVAETSSKGIPLRVIKAVAKGPWAAGQTRDRATWYEPFGDRRTIDACVHYALSHEGINAFASAGDVGLFPGIVEAVERFGKMDDAEAQALLAAIPDYASPFGSPTSIA
ncbi:aldo/keto reductase [Paenibacillus hemerocallicola]|uniref:Aldo/keto reductase n=1 Tax=Paenibacillus hemerocallicola TaxID=1172614 RepID=A0A5C4T1D9_9BACL|nr:aldo/keto reductase [Paenibacillus hemerocallicola]TNJ62928.1 aldo/keto reductase [Paenibacillus hemerocallicola]